uniref:Uncharacterized protein n=1 Tax=Anguilla anguilla TaxID=7936 RepID=A0A0E9TJP0_ANGAN
MFMHSRSFVSSNRCTFCCKQG